MTTTTGPNLIVNGGFEDNALNNSGYTWQDLNSGWVNIGSRNANILEQDYGHGNATGDAVAELECGVVLCQEVNVPEAGKYIFLFDVSRRGTSDQDNKFELYINGVKYETYVAQGQETIEIELDLSAGTTRFDFKSLSHTYKGAGLDDVALHNVQEDPGSISGRYFNDRDCDGIEDQGEEGFANKIIKLRDADTGAIVAETRTDQNGNYSFDNVEPGRYCVIFEKMDGFSPTKRDAGNDDTIDSDLKSNGESHIFRVNPGEHEDNIDAGLKADPAWIKGRLTFDEDCNDNEFNDNTGTWDRGVEG